MQTYETIKNEVYKITTTREPIRRDAVMKRIEDIDYEISNHNEVIERSQGYIDSATQGKETLNAEREELLSLITDVIIPAEFAKASQIEEKL